MIGAIVGDDRTGVISLDAATVLLQWATGGLAFLWVTTRHRAVGTGYGWLVRGIFGTLAAVAAVAGVRYGGPALRTAAAIAVAAATFVALGVSVVRHRGAPGPEYPPRLDLVAPALGIVGLLAAGWSSAAATPDRLLAVARVLCGAAFLGAVTDAMLLGHWYLVQPGLPRRLLLEPVRWLGRIWPVEVALLLVPTGMVSVLAGSIDDGYNGMLGWFWIACAVTTIGLVFVTRAALRERAYSAVMAATGLLYLAILTAFGTDLVARAVLAS